MKLVRFVCWSFAILTTQSSVCMAGFGDYVDPTFNCPASTTCPVVCVSSYADCPEQMRCPDGQQLCPDGSCDEFCSPNLISPCEHDCALVACAKIIATFDSCMTDFAPWYGSGCSDDSKPGDESDGYDPSWTDPGFMLVYLWVVANSLGIFAWSWFKYALMFATCYQALMSFL